MTSSEDRIRAATVGEPERLTGRLAVVDYDPAWPGEYRREADRIRSALGDRVKALEHVGSTSVPDLAAKPIVDLVLVVADSAEEEAYLPLLERAGYRLRIREPGWYEHRMLKGPDVDVNLHVFSAGCPEVDRMLLFRDWLRTHDDDREAYAAVKRDLAGREWAYVQDYADAKTPIVEAILGRANKVPPAASILS